MADLFELYASRAATMGSNPSVRLMYMLGLDGQRTSDEAEVRAAILANVPPNYESLILSSTDHEHVGGGLWRITADYALPTFNRSSGNPSDIGGDPSDPAEEGGGDEAGESDAIPAEVTVDGTAQMTRVMYALKTVTRLGRNGDYRALPDHHGAVNVNDGRAEGVDIPSPSMVWSETWSWRDQYVTWGYFKRLRNLIGRVNRSRFRTFKAGEVMFLGFTSPAATEEGRRTISYNFKTEPNVDYFRLTPDFDPVSKKGHQYLEVVYEQTTNETETEDADYIAPKPRAILIHEVGPDDATEPPTGPTNERYFGLMGIGK